jgi:thiol-disulfide isomerase/thioredoxin
MTVAPSNLVTVSSAEHFTSLMSADLNRVSLLNFWASWAEPCEQMNAVVTELAEKFPQVLCLMVSRLEARQVGAVGRKEMRGCREVHTFSPCAETPSRTLD